jgi:eukaryotic-like serine/threonine-protein kinase
MFTGRYATQSAPKTGESSRNTKLAPPMQIDPKIPGTLNEAMLACLEMNPDKRPAGVFEVKNQLEAVAKYLGVSEADLKGSEEEEE